MKRQNHDENHSSKKLKIEEDDRDYCSKDEKKEQKGDYEIPVEAKEKKIEDNSEETRMYQKESVSYDESDCNQKADADRNDAVDI